MPVITPPRTDNYITSKKFLIEKYVKIKMNCYNLSDNYQKRDFMKTKPKLYLIKTISLLLIFSTLFAGCSTTIVKMEGETTEQYHKRINELCKEESNFTILTIEGKEYSADKINLTVDNLSFNEFWSDSLCSFSPNDIKTIHYSENWVGNGILCSGIGLGSSIPLCFFLDAFPEYLTLLGIFGLITGFVIGAFTTQNIIIPIEAE